MAGRPPPSTSPGSVVHGRERTRAVERVLLVTLGLNLLAAAVKLAAAGLSGSLALAAGGVDSLFDGAANVVGLGAMRIAARPPDANHPYGHRKFETLVAVAVAAAMFLTCGRIVWSAGIALVTGRTATTVTLATIVAPLAAFAFNALASTYEARRGRALSSELLLADAGHTRADAAVSLAIVGGLLAVRAGYPLVDPLLALGIAGLIAWAGVGIVRDFSNVLADAAALDPATIERLARAVPGVAGVHKVRSRGPIDAVAIDLHVQVDPALGIGRAHAIGHHVQAQLRACLPGVVDVVVHVEPKADGQSETA